MIAQKLEVIPTPTGMKLIIDTNDRTCGEKLAEPTGGKAKINGPVLAVLG